MTNKMVISRFLSGQPGSSKNLHSYGHKLVNYSTMIAYHKDGKVCIDTKKYSVTTSKIQYHLKRLADESGLEVSFYESNAYFWR